MSLLKDNQKKAVNCKGCSWLHIGEKVSHNHCDHIVCRDRMGGDRRANNRIDPLNPDEYKYPCSYRDKPDKLRKRSEYQ